MVDDADVDHFGFNPISSPEVAGLPFLVTVQAYDILNNPIAVYSQTVALAAMGSSGTISVDPTTVTFANGVWTGDVTVGAADPAVTLQVDNGAGCDWHKQHLRGKEPTAGRFDDPGSQRHLRLAGSAHLHRHVQRTSCAGFGHNRFLDGVGHVQHTVTGVTLSTDDMTATFTIDGITTEGTLTASIPTGAISDQYGFPIAAFSARYLVDITTIAFPGPLTAVNPSGSLVYQGSADGNA